MYPISRNIPRIKSQWLCLIFFNRYPGAVVQKSSPKKGFNIANRT
jgi:hypothetical protein